MELNGSDGGEYVNLRLGGAAAADRRLSCPGKRSGADAADERGEGDQSSVGRSGSLSRTFQKGACLTRGKKLNLIC